MKLGSYLISYTNINSKCTKGLSIRPEIVEPLEENIGQKLFDIGLGKDFFGFDTKSKGNKNNHFLKSKMT